MKSHYFAIIHNLSSIHSIPSLLAASGLSRSGYYKWRARSISSQSSTLNTDIKQHIIAIHSVRPFYGYRRVTVAITKEGFRVNHKRVYRLMKELGIQSIIRKKRKFYGKSGSIVFQNLLQRNFKSVQPLQKLATDITYIPYSGGFLYLSAMQDLHNNEVVSFSISKRNDLKLVLDMLRRLSGSVQKDTILHSDQGFQYTTRQYKRELERIGILGSHSRKGNCLDNACIESFFSHLKSEAFLSGKLMDIEETEECVREYIQFYNNERFQKRLGQLSPAEFREKLAA